MVKFFLLINILFNQAEAADNFNSIISQMSPPQPVLNSQVSSSYDAQWNQASQSASCSPFLVSAFLTGVQAASSGGLNGVVQNAKCGLNFITSVANAPCIGMAQSQNQPQNEMDICQMDPSLARAEELQAQQSVCYNVCQESKAFQMQQQASCLQGQVTVLYNKIAAQGQAIEQAIITAHKQIINVDTAISDRKSQSELMDTTLNGSGGGSGGLLDMQKTLNEGLTQIPISLQQLKTNQADYLVQQQTLSSMLNTRTNQVAMDCFATQPQGNAICPPNSPPSSFKDYVSCIFKNSSLVGSNNQIDGNGLLTKSAATISNQINTILEQMVNAAGGQNDSSNKDQSGGLSTTSSMTLAQLQSVYLPKLAGFTARASNGTIITAQQEVQSMLNYCSNYAQNQVSAEQNNGSSLIGQQVAKVTDTKATLDSGYLTSLNQGYQAFYGSYANFLNTNTPANVAGPCASIQTNGNSGFGPQQSCLTSLQTNIQGLLYGGGSQYTKNYNFGGVGGALTLSCNGINNCVSSINSTKKTVTNEMNVLETKKTTYANQTNSNIDSYVNGITNSTNLNEASNNLQSAQLLQGISKLNALAGGIGQPAITVPSMTKQEPTIDKETGLYQINNPAHYIGGSMNPPMVDMGSDGFQNMISEANAAIVTTKQNEATAEANLGYVESRLQQCKEQNEAAIIQGIGDVPGLHPSSCHSSQYCQNNNATQLSNIANRLSEIARRPTLNYQNNMGYNGSNGVMSLASGNISSQIQQACVQPPPDGVTRNSEAECNAFFNSLLGAQKSLNDNDLRYSTGGVTGKSAR